MLSFILIYVLFICHITSAQVCSSGRDIEFLTDGQLFTTTLYKPFNSSFTVRCRRCTGSGRPSWFSGTEISSCSSGVSTAKICTRDATRRRDKDLVISSFAESLEGDYQCIRNNNKSRVTSIKVLFEIITHPQDRLVPVGSSVSLTCTSSVSSDVTFSWTSDSRDVTGQSTSTGNTSILKINKIGRKRNGTSYVCTVSNGSVSVMSDTAILTVYGPPEITAHPTGGDVPMGRSIALMCRASGLGTLVYSWERIRSGSSWTSINNAKATSYTTSRRMAIGEYMYRCNVSNEAGSVSSNSTTVNVYGPPEITDHPTGSDVPTGKSITLMCRASGLGTLAYSWERRSSGNSWTTVSNDNTTSYTTDTTLTIGKYMYRCNVSNEAGSVVSNRATVNVYGPPTIKTHPTSQLINVSMSVTLNCEGTGRGSITYQWQTRNINGGQWSVISNSNNRRLVVRNFQESQQYSCVVANGAGGTRSNVATVTVLKITTHPSNTTVIALQVVTLTCSASVDDVTYSWHRDGGSVPSRSRGQDSNMLIIRRATPPDEGMYYCMASKEGISVESKKATLTVDDMLFINATSSNFLKNETETAQLTVLADGVRKENFVYEWKVKNKDLPDKVIGVNGTVLTIPDLVKSDEGEYYCTVSNQWGRSMESNTITLTVSANQPQPAGTSDDSSGGGGSVIVPVVGVVVSLIIIIIIIIIVILMLLYYKRRSKSQDRSMTSTTNGIPMREKNTQAKKGVEPSQDLLEETPIRDASFTICIESDKMDTSVGQPTTLFIEIPDLHKPEVTWLKDGRPVNHPVLPDGSLFIINTEISDQGKYTVTVSSDGNVASENIQLTVHNPRLPVDNSELSTIQVEDFAEHVVLMKDEGNAVISEEFESIVVDVPFTQHAGKTICNKPKNRYKNILPYDHSRVVLSQQEQLTGSDYINASFVNGHGNSRVYIAAQGPLKNTVDDFWRLIWEQNVATVVMVTRLVEDAKIKCQQYWPNDGSTVFGTIKVTLQKEEQLRSYCVRQLSITNVSSLKRETRVVHQFHFTAWPDHGVPKYGTALLEFQKRVDKHYMGKSYKPMLVHCSAGVGRTGTFIAINNEIKRIKQEGVTDIHSFVCQMRFCRNFMVQTLPQYMFIHMALLEYINCGDTSIVAPINNVQNKIDELSTINPKKGKTGFQMQFEKLVRNSSKESDFTYVAAVSSKNKSKNRCKQFLPPESARVIVPQYDGSSDYINFCFVDGYYKSKAFLAGPGPMQSTATDFWTMVWEKKSYAIVMLGQIKENEAEASFKYWPVENKSVEFGRFLIETILEDVWDKDIVKRTFKVTNVHQDTTRTITQLQYVEWPQDSCPNSHTPIIDLIKVLEYVQHENGNGPITVHCSNGVGRSGTFCALVICINQFKQEQMVDMFQTVQIMRSQRPGLVENTEQYEFIYRALVAAVQKQSS